MAADSNELCKQSTFGKINASSCFAYILGPLIGALLSTKSLAAPFFMISFVCIVNATISYFTVTNRILFTKATIEPFLQRINFIARLRRLFKNPQLKLMLLSVSLHTLAEDIFYELSPTFLISKWSLGSSSLAIYNSTLCMSLAVGGGFAAGFLAKRFPRRKVLTWTMLLFVACLLSVLIIPSPLPVLGVFGIIGFAIAIPATNLTVQVSNSVSDDIQGEVMGVQASLRVLGSAIICFFGSILISLSPSLIMLVAALISLASLAYYLKGIRSPKLAKYVESAKKPLKQAI